MTPAECIKSARELIADPSRHTTGCMARDQAGREVSPTFFRAVAWCARGALSKVADEKHYASLYCAIDICRNAALRLTGTGLEPVNDIRGHAAVLSVLDAAYEDAKG